MISFITGSQCSFSGCVSSADPTTCVEVNWRLDEAASLVTFNLARDTAVEGRWIGVGFSDDMLMANSDIVTGYVSSGNAVVDDRYATGRSIPAIDSDQSQVSPVGHNVVNGSTTIQFTRTLQSSDVLDLSLDVPRYFLVATGDVSGGNIAQHNFNGRWTSTTMIDVQTNCLIPTPAPTTADASTTIPPSITTTQATVTTQAATTKTPTTKSPPSTDSIGTTQATSTTQTPTTATAPTG